jgi:hypothetical protein
MANIRKVKRVLNMGALDVIRIARNPRLAIQRLFPPQNHSPQSAIRAILTSRPKTPTLTEIDFVNEFQLDHAFFAAINDEYVPIRGRRIHFTTWAEFLYAAVRNIRPSVVVLTGVFDGHTDAAILRAMQRNDKGQLISIDLPAISSIANATDAMKDTTLPTGQQPGWVVPDFLRSRYDLRLGDSRALLPQVLEEYPNIDFFVHDSLHTYHHQLFEYTTAWPAICEGGILMSDDILYNMAFPHFASRVGRQTIRIDGFGLIVK